MQCKTQEEKFLTHHNLQGSQTEFTPHTIRTLFLTHHNLQGSQTIDVPCSTNCEFLTHHNLQGSQTGSKPDVGSSKKNNPGSASNSTAILALFF